MCTLNRVARVPGMGAPAWTSPAVRRATALERHTENVPRRRANTTIGTIGTSPRFAFANGPFPFEHVPHSSWAGRSAASAAVLVTTICRPAA
jgi:hypothetical protein